MRWTGQSPAQRGNRSPGRGVLHTGNWRTLRGCFIAAFGEKGHVVLIVAGLSLKNLQPRVWDPSSPFHIPDLRAVMVSYADFHKMQARRTQAMKVGLRAYLGVPKGVEIYLDNGAFYFA